MIAICFSIFAKPAGYCLHFEGGEEYVDLGSPFTLGMGSNTVEMWVQVPIVGEGGLSSGERVGILLGNFDDTPNANWEIYSNGEIRIYWDNATIERLGTTDLRDGKWHHIAMVRDKSINSFVAYIDGVEEFSVTDDGLDLNFTSAHYIGGDRRADDSPNFHGKIDEVRVWTIDRTADEIRKYMYSELTGLETNLEAYYDFNEGTGTFIDNKEGNTAYDGTLHNMTDANFLRSGAFEGANNAAQFDGIDDYITVPRHANLEFETNFSIETWINPDNWNTSSRYEFIGSTQGDGYSLFIVDGSVSFQIYSGSYRSYSADVSTLTGWHHIASTYDGRYMKIYIDGKLEMNHDLGSSGNLISHTANNSLCLGGDVGSDAAATERFYNGQMDEVRFWDKVLTEQEIQANMCHSLTGNEAGLVAYYRLDELDGSYAYDIANSHDGTLSNMDLGTCRVSSNAFTTWIGTTSTVWNSDANWSDGFPSGTSDNSSIPDGYAEPAVEGVYNTNNFVIPVGGSYDINSGDLIVNTNYYQFGNLRTGGGNLILKKNAFGPSGQRLIVGGSGAEFSSMPLFD